MATLVRARMLCRYAMDDGRKLFRDVIIPGGIAGSIGFVASTLAMAGLGLLTSKGAGHPFLLLAGVFFREGGQSGVWPIVIGLAIHFAVSGGVATAFAMLLPRGGTAVAAIGFGQLFMFAVHVSMIEFVIPYVCPPLSHSEYEAGLFLMNVLFGFSLATVVPFRRRTEQASRIFQAIDRWLEQADGPHELAALEVAAHEARRRLRSR